MATKIILQILSIQLKLLKMFTIQYTQLLSEQTLNQQQNKIAMEETENYLNNILKKRLGSVPNQGGFSKNANTVTRLPRKQQKLQSMPTVFRNKTQTIYRTTGVMPGQFQSKNPLLTAYNSKEPPQMKKQDSGQNQRVQYVAISKRLEGKKQDFTAPTVDVSKYRKTTYIPPNQITHDPNQHLKQFENQRNPRLQTQNNNAFYKFESQNIHKLKTQQSRQINQQQILGKQAILKPIATSQMSRVSQFSQSSQGGRRKNIFGMSKQKSKTNLQ